MLTVNNRYEVAHAVHNFLFACEGDALFALDLPHYLKLETTRLFSRVLFGTMMYVRVSYVCLRVCSLANCICNAYAMYVNTRNSHKYTNTYMLFDWVIVLMPGDFLFFVIPLSLKN